MSNEHIHPGNCRFMRKVVMPYRVLCAKNTIQAIFCDDMRNKSYTFKKL